MFTLRFSQVFPSLPMGLHKPSFQKRQTSSATSSCIFYLIPNVQKATLPKASVHKGDREALQKSILFEYRESLPHPLPGGVSGRFGARSLLLSPVRSSFPRWPRSWAGTAFPPPGPQLQHIPHPSGIQLQGLFLLSSTPFPPDLFPGCFLLVIRAFGRAHATFPCLEG